jgi:hypothetical protein
MRFIFIVIGAVVFVFVVVGFFALVVAVAVMGELGRGWRVFRL